MRFSLLLVPAIAAALVGAAPARAQQVPARDTRLRVVTGLSRRTATAVRFGNDVASRAGLTRTLVLRASPETMHSVVPSIALHTASALPTIATGGGTRLVRPELKVAMRWTTRSPLSLEASAAYARVPDGATSASRGTVSFVSSYEIAPRVSVYVEGFAYGRPGAAATPAQFADAGIAVRIAEGMQLELRGGRGFGGGATGEQMVGIGLARRW